MRLRQVMKLGSLLLILSPIFAFGQTPTVYHFANHAYQLTLPEGYTLQEDAPPELLFRSLTFMTPLRSDGTRGVIQVTVADVRREDQSLAKVSASVLAGFRERAKQRTGLVEWAGKEEDVTLAGVPAKRTEWNGKVESSRPGAPTLLPVRGVFYVGVKNGICFALNTQDVEPLATTTVPLGERTLLSFTLEPEVPVVAAAQTATAYHFAEHAYQLTLPEGYALAMDANPVPLARALAFATLPRSDDTRSIIQVTVLDLRREEQSVEKLAARIVASIKRTRTEWASKETHASLAGAPARRVEWTGKAEPGRRGLPQVVAMQGVIYVGIKDGIGFSLSTQDIEPLAATTVPLCERAIVSFTLEPEMQ